MERGGGGRESPRFRRPTGEESRGRGGGGDRRENAIRGPERSDDHRRREESSQRLDLGRRTLDTLDYPLVLGALADECGTVPARDIIEREITGLPPPAVAGKKSAHGGAGRKREGSGDGRASADSEDEFDLDSDVLTMPLTALTASGARRRYAAVAEMRRLLLSYDGTNKKLRPPPMSGFTFDLKPIFEMTDVGQVLEGPEILEVTSTLNTLEKVRRWGENLGRYRPDDGRDGRAGGAEEGGFEELPLLTSHINVDPDLLSLLTNAFDDTGRLSSTTFPAVGRLRSRVRALKSDVLSRLETLLVTPSLKSKLSLESGGSAYSEVNGRIVVPVGDKHGNAVGIVHDMSRSGKTLYVEPTELIGPTNEMRSTEAELRAEEARVWRMLTESVLEHRVEIERSVAAAAQIDLVGARGRLGQRLGGVIPTVGDSGVIDLKDARHPVLLLRDLEDVVANDVSLGVGSNRGLVLTGPNSGGKTVVLKLLGLAALMARDGIPVPAAAAPSPSLFNGDEEDDKVRDASGPRVDFFSPILADIGDLQSVDGDLSTFSGHMLVCKEVLERTMSTTTVPSNGSPGCSLVLMDELGSGTDPAQGVAIARALLEALVDAESRVALTTHYTELKQLASSDDRFGVGGMQFVGGRPTYKFVPGVVGESFALAVAERMGLPESVLERANELLDSDTRRMGELIRDMEDQKDLIDRQAQEIEAKRSEMDGLAMEMRAQQRKLETKQLGARRDEAKKFAIKLEEKERVLEDILERLKSDPSKRVVARSWDDVRFVKRDALTEAENLPSVLRRKHEAAASADAALGELVPLSEMREKPKLSVGDTLVICKKGGMRGKQVKIVELGNKILVNMGKMPIRLKMSELSLLPPSMPAQAAYTAADKFLGPNGEQLSKEARRAMGAGGEEFGQATGGNNNSSGGRQRGSAGGGESGMRLEANTVDVRGLNFDEAKQQCLDKFSRVMMQKDPVVYVLHGHGTGVLRKKLRDWMGRDRRWVRGFSKADDADGGDAFTKVKVKKVKF